MTKIVQSGITMSDEECELVSQIVMKQAGIKLGVAKKTMMQSRLDKRLVFLEIPDYSSYLHYLKKHNNEIETLVNSLTTNKTEFWRESSHFDSMMEYIDIHFRHKNDKNPLYVWSAACSTGEEVYTIAMLLEDYKESNPSFAYRILGTDIDTNILNRAQSAEYSIQILKDIPPRLSQKYCMKGTGKFHGRCKIRPSLLENIKFRQHNLIDPMSGYPVKFDIVFLRNVLIYFDQENIQIVINKLVRHMHNGSYLFIGHSESLNGIDHRLKSISSATFKKVVND